MHHNPIFMALPSSVTCLAACAWATAGPTCGTQVVFDLSPFTPFSAAGEVIGVTTVQGEIVHARIDAEFVSNDEGLWSMDIAFEIGGRVAGISSSIEGWAGTGIFIATLETDLLNGFLVSGGGPFVEWYLQWTGGVVEELPEGGIVVVPVDGYFETLTLTLTLAECPSGDLTGDYEVNVFDLLELLGSWGACEQGEMCSADLDDDGFVNVFDLLLLLGNWGSYWCPPPLC